MRGNPINLIDPSGFTPDCIGEQPCIVIVGAKYLGDTGEGGNTEDYGHAFLLVVDPNRRWRSGFGEGRPDQINSLPVPPPIFASTSDNAKSLNELIKEPSTVYFFRGGPEGNPATSLLTTEYGYYTKGSTLDYLPQSGVYKTLADNISCPYILKCFKDVMKHVNSLELGYDLGYQRNSNTVVASALRRCGLNAEHPFPNLKLPQWDEDIDDNNWLFNWGDEEHSNEDWPDTYPIVPQPVINGSNSN